MKPVDKKKNIPINDLRKAINWRKSCFKNSKPEFLAEDMSVFSKIMPPENSCCFGNIIDSSLIINLLVDIINLAGTHYLDSPYDINSMEFNFKKPVYLENIIIAQGYISKSKVNGDNVIEAFLYNDRKELCVDSIAMITFY